MNARIIREFQPEVFLQSKRTLWVVGLVIIVSFLVSNLPWRLDDYDQAKQAFTSFEMVKEGHRLYQRTPHDRVATKPPLVAWISAGVFELTRSWNVAWRLPSIAAAVALSILLFRASSVYGAVGGLIALSAFAFNLLTPRLASLVRTDMPLALIVFLIGAQIWQHFRERRGWSTRDRVLLFFFLTAGILIKGPIVYAFLFPGVLLFVWWHRKTKTDARGCGWWPWLAALAVFLLWVIGGCIFIPKFYDQVVLHEFLGRFGETAHRPQPIYFYLPHLLVKFAPWSVLIIAFALMIVRSEKTKVREVFRKISPETFWLICWSLGGLLVMSLIPSKRVDRIFPVIPPLCLLLAAQVKAMLAQEQLRARALRWSAVALLFSLLFTVGYTFGKIVSGYRNHRDALVKFSDTVRDEAARHQWRRYEVVSADDEGLLLYLDRLHFIKPERAIPEWNQDKIDALVVPVEKAPRFVRDLQNVTVSGIRSEAQGEGMGYILLTR